MEIDISNKFQEVKLVLLYNRSLTPAHNSSWLHRTMLPKCFSIHFQDGGGVFLTTLTTQHVFYMSDMSDVKRFLHKQITAKIQHRFK